MPERPALVGPDDIVLRKKADELIVPAGCEEGGAGPPWRPGRLSAVDITTMSDLDDQDGRQAVIDRVEDSVVALPETVLVLAGQLLRTLRSRVSTEALDLGSGALPILRRQRFELFRG